MADFSLLFVPLLFGLILATTICRALVFWQMERTPRVLAFFFVFFSLCCLYLVTALALPPPARDLARTGLLLSLLAANWFDWAALLGFLRKKYERKVESPAASQPAPALAAPPVTKTLATLADEHGPVKLEATENKPVEARP